MKYFIGSWTFCAKILIYWIDHHFDSFQIYRISNDVYSVEWNALPLEFEKYIAVMLPLLQKERFLTGYGILKCDWLTFASVFFFVIESSTIILKYFNFIFYFSLLEQLFRLYYYFGSLYDLIYSNKDFKNAF